MLKCQRFGLPVIYTFVSHDREFIFNPRGFDNVDQMNKTILKNINACVDENDELYILGDVMLGDNEKGLEYLREINCKNIHIILGNHDTSTREKLYKAEPNVIEVTLAKRLRACGYHFYLSHYPTLTANLDDNGKSLKQKVINICGHSHTTNPFTDWNNYNSPIFHCEADTNNGYPWAIDDIIKKIKEMG